MTGAHFHGPAFPGAVAGIVVDIGSISGGLTSPIIGQTTLTPAQAAELLAGKWYINIHSQAHPDGEIRAQVSGLGIRGLTLFPRSGVVAKTSGFDLTLLIDTSAGRTPVGGTIKFNGQNITALLQPCIRVGTLRQSPPSNQPIGVTVRCSVPGNALPPAEDANVFDVVIDFDDGSQVGNTISLGVENNTEP